jgi:PAS domain S-box-containing protein
MNFDNDSLNLILDNLRDGLYIVDLDRTISYWNKAAKEISGYTGSAVFR